MDGTLPSFKSFLGELGDRGQSATQDSEHHASLSLQSPSQRRRKRRKFDEIVRLYRCNWGTCSKSYGTLNHLNHHVVLQSHGPRRQPEEFKELRAWLKSQQSAADGESPQSPVAVSSAVKFIQPKVTADRDYVKSASSSSSSSAMLPPTMLRLQLPPLPISQHLGLSNIRSSDKTSISTLLASSTTSEINSGSQSTSDNETNVSTTLSPVIPVQDLLIVEDRQPATKFYSPSLSIPLSSPPIEEEYLQQHASHSRPPFVTAHRLPSLASLHQDVRRPSLRPLWSQKPPSSSLPNGTAGVFPSPLDDHSQ